ncbi:hypothetical protein AL537_20630 [Vibrio diabolicus]|nr:hypothetical protein AL537_20630 [Vibrio diabolicus]
MRMTCNTCKKKGDCSFSFLGFNNKHISCNHYQITQNIVSRNFSFFGSEYLSRPRRMYYKNVIPRYGIDDHMEVENHEEYFNNMNVLDHNKMLKEIIFKLKKSLLNGHDLPDTIFINVEKFSLFDKDIIENLSKLTKNMDKSDKTLVIEITERHEALDELMLQIIPYLSDRGLNLALDDYILTESDHPIVKYFDFIKIEVSELYKISNPSERLYDLVEKNRKIIIEKIESKEQLNFALSLPIHYLQGFYI